VGEEGEGEERGIEIGKSVGEKREICIDGLDLKDDSFKLEGNVE
jgi:hypothetical protein